MNLQQQREEARRRRLVNRSVIQHRQRHFDDVRLGTVVPVLMPDRNLPRGLMSPLPEAIPVPLTIDNPQVTRLLKGTIVATMLGLLLQFQAPLAQAVLALVAG